MFFSNQRWDGAGRQGFPEQFFDFRQAPLVRVAHQRPRPARRPSATNATDPVNIIFSMDRQVHHHDVAQARNIHAPRGNIRCHQQLHFLAAKGIN